MDDVPVAAALERFEAAVAVDVEQHCCTIYWTVRIHKACDDEVEVASDGFKLVPDMQQLNTLRQREAEALRKCLQAREKKKEDTMEAQIEQLQAGMTKIDDQGRKNTELIKGLEDLMRGGKTRQV